MKLNLLSVNVGRPHILGTVNGETVLSGIAKKPLDGDSVFVGATNLEGDGQADLSVHGGPDKAVYAYPTVHWPWWESEHRLPCGPNTFGENLTLEGADESQICIGDRFQWGEALLEVSQPRAPCFKLAMHTRREDVPQLMTLSARCGWYLRVVREGVAPLRHAALVRTFESGEMNVKDVFVAVMHPRIARETLLRVSKLPALAHAWRHAVARHLARQVP
ncbi:MAG: MOSC domain-containing protein [Proteobacteria bacterium]|nr:MOSC domain-containing protein [Pseudomonadota bacterium]